MQNDDKRTSDIGASDARPPDDGLILRIAEGDTAALEVLYRQTSASVYGFALSILRDPTAAEDVMQDTFVSVMQSASSYQPSGTPMAWLLTIARNLALMRLRKAENKNISFDELFHVEDPHNAYREMENHMVLDKVLRLLTDSERQIVMLHALSGLKHREVADLLDIPQATAISRYNRALHQRNALIKQAQSAAVDPSLWEIYADQLSSLSADIASRRLSYMTELSGYVEALFDSMTVGAEKPGLIYTSVLEKEHCGDEEIISDGRERLRALLCDNIKREIAYGSTLYGVHKDDFSVMLCGREAKLYASQGQQRSLALAMKLAEGEMSRAAGGEDPVFLLDDVLSELDEGRRGFVISKLCGRQIIITSCEPDALTKYSGTSRLICVENGMIKDV